MEKQGPLQGQMAPTPPQDGRGSRQTPSSSPLELTGYIWEAELRAPLHSTFLVGREVPPEPYASSRPSKTETRAANHWRALLDPGRRQIRGVSRSRLAGGSECDVYGVFQVGKNSSLALSQSSPSSISSPGHGRPVSYQGAGAKGQGVPSSGSEGSGADSGSHLSSS